MIGEVEEEDGKCLFQKDPWEKWSSTSTENNYLIGFGTTAVIQKGAFIEKGI